MAGGTREGDRCRHRRSKLTSKGSRWKGRPTLGAATSMFRSSRAPRRRRCSSRRSRRWRSVSTARRRRRSRSCSRPATVTPSDRPAPVPPFASSCARRGQVVGARFARRVLDRQRVRGRRDGRRRRFPRRVRAAAPLRRRPPPPRALALPAAAHDGAQPPRQGGDRLALRPRQRVLLDVPRPQAQAVLASAFHARRRDPRGGGAEQARLHPRGLPPRAGLARARRRGGGWGSFRAMPRGTVSTSPCSRCRGNSSRTCRRWPTSRSAPAASRPGS